MKKYKIEQKILTLAHCAVMERENNPASFSVDGIEFSHWDFNIINGWTIDAWIAFQEIEAANFVDAINSFRALLSKIVPRISLICQSYISFTQEPFIVHELSSEVAFIEYSQDVKSVGLMFMEKESEALRLLLQHKNIPEEFYYYWNEAVNSYGYAAKLLLMFSAVEALVKVNGKKDWKLMDAILGRSLVKQLFGTKKNTRIGLRHRLVHGEYFNPLDKGNNYLELIHENVIGYFNTHIFLKPLIQENVVNPQRHFFGNKSVGRFFLQRNDGVKSFSLRDLVSDLDTNGFQNPQRYKHVFDNSIGQTY